MVRLRQIMMSASQVKKLIDDLTKACADLDKTKVSQKVSVGTVTDDLFKKDALWIMILTDAVAQFKVDQANNEFEGAEMDAEEEK